MNRSTDQELLRDYAEDQAEAAFTELVRRHVDLVYSAAMRMVRDAQLAEEVTQSVFLALAHNASQLTNRPVVSGWLHRTAQNLAANVIRADSRRRVREQEAAAMNEVLANSPDANWDQIAPHLDAALGELSEPERNAVMLRYFEKRSAQEMAAILGISTEAAQKRVTRAVGHLRRFFARRGVSVGAGGLALLMSANAVNAAPAGLFATISTAVLSQVALQSTAALAATKSMTTLLPVLHKSLVAVLIAGGVVFGGFEAHRVSTLKGQLQLLPDQPSQAGPVEQLRLEREEAAGRLAGLKEENEQLQREVAEIPRLHAEAARLRRRVEMGMPKAPVPPAHPVAILHRSADAAGMPMAAAGADVPPNPNPPWTEALRANRHRLEEFFERMPEKGIPELRYLSDRAWLAAASRTNLETDDGLREAASSIRDFAKQTFGGQISDALRKYIVEHDGDLPTALRQLKPYINPPPDDALLDRYKLVHSGKFRDVPRGEWRRMAVEDTAPVDGDDSWLVQIGLFTVSLGPRNPTGMAADK